MNLDEFLSSRHVAFERLHHRPAYTANRTAQVLHVPGREVAKTVLLRAGKGYALAVLPATHRVDLERVSQDLGGERVELASEEDMGRLFPDCERGAVPPFGSLYRLPTLVDESLAEDEEIVFEAQSHEDAIRMSYRDFEELEHPRKGHFGQRV
jgi:Ala-tRNA(Pro) deacylase